MKIEFIQKRINEQLKEIASIADRYQSKEIDLFRFNELRNSAISQLEYFTEKEKEVLR